MTYHIHTIFIPGTECDKNDRATATFSIEILLLSVWQHYFSEFEPQSAKKYVKRADSGHKAHSCPRHGGLPSARTSAGNYSCTPLRTLQPSTKDAPSYVIVPSCCETCICRPVPSPNIMFTLPFRRQKLRSPFLPL